MYDKNKKGKFMIPEQFTIVQSLELLYLLISRQFDNLHAQYANFAARNEIKEISKVSKLLNLLLDDFYEGVNNIEELYRCEKVLRVGTWKETNMITMIEDFFILDQNIRITKNNAKTYVDSNKSGVGSLLNKSLGIGKNKMKKDEEQEGYVFKEANRIKKSRELEKQKKSELETEKQLLLEKNIEAKLRTELKHEYHKAIEEEKAMESRLRSSIEKEYHIRQLEHEKLLESKLRVQLEHEYSKKTDEERKIHLKKRKDDSQTEKENLDPIKNKPQEKRRVSSIPSISHHTESESRPIQHSASVSRKLPDNFKYSRKSFDDSVNRRSSSDLTNGGRAANFAWSNSLQIDTAISSHSSHSSHTHHSSSATPTTDRYVPKSVKRSKSVETIKSNHEGTKPLLNRSLVKTQKKIVTSRRSESEKRELDKKDSKVPKSPLSSSHKSSTKPKVVLADALGTKNYDNSDSNSTLNLYEETPMGKRVKEVMNSLQGVDKKACEQIVNDIIVMDEIIRWEDIAGLNNAKVSLRETVEYPFLRPDLFKGLREPIRGLLLFGPPGTGKTMIAKAVAYESNSTFFSISASSLLSKYLGESEKLVRALFYLAKRLAPSIIFIDEIDSLLTARSDNENESSRRIKTELLIQWSILSSATSNGNDNNESDNRVLLLAATNLPWAIDEAARRRFSRRLYIPLPEYETRLVHLQKLLGFQKHTLSPEDLQHIARITEGYSGSDITTLAKEAAMIPIRDLGENLLDITTDKIRGVNVDDFILAMETVKKSVSPESLQEYSEWSEKYGSTGV
ncbi:hypothetical protein Kpol_1048p61 [Vanderwaltozyma polyspora DSM 70294]|uniref:AAA+ ATPase domain-containing protein n=1 Tax=Vanderwaltozyma polyspora (strain ATCC 22028 / DSM 70294 / BCRC 21397 / CBS 2163 / NBRC 10782 / NRRL Y-8283 / UCD 57-17) TaxID=436907 RepID=A7TGM3_VANPO|nr:uncharacterized protein Kpol_1048p61 [Vanderwaltozyma polyspora DSM 70294]EDO18630.1 hypothetical protein Kpol_1048p61 [Vanderwaltozyma polyspora DSM 70294]